jgi:hypothetical protein
MDNALFRRAVSRLEATRMSPTAPCKICGGEAHPYDIVDFSKSCEMSIDPGAMSIVPVVYRLCAQCQFIFTDFFDGFTDDQWRRYVYNDDYIQVDPEYATIRPRENVRMVSAFLAGKKKSIMGLDFGGGNGLTARLLRERGWIYDSYDPFGDNDMAPERIGQYNFCSAIEVFEHSPDPVGSLRAIVEKVSRGRLLIMISTVASDGAVSPETRLSWWYAAPRNGHVSLYSHKSFEILGSHFDLGCVFIKSGPCFLTRGYTEAEARRLVVQGKLLRRLRRVLGK